MRKLWGAALKAHKARVARETAQADAVFASRAERIARTALLQPFDQAVAARFLTMANLESAAPDAPIVLGYNGEPIGALPDKPASLLGLSVSPRVSSLPPLCRVSPAGGFSLPAAPLGSAHA
jgi:hypothetical protein